MNDALNHKPPSVCKAPPAAPRHVLSRGFTLIELLSVMAVSAVLLSVAMPPLTAFVNSVQLSSASNAFVSGLHLARSEAIKRNARVVVCKSADGVVCGRTGGWEQGWIVFQDDNNDGERDEDELIVQREQHLASSLRLVGNLNLARYVSFNPSGATQLVSGGFQAGTLTVCKQSLDGGEARQIVLNAVGRPRVQKTVVRYCA